MGPGPVARRPARRPRSGRASGQRRTRSTQHQAPGTGGSPVPASGRPTPPPHGPTLTSRNRSPDHHGQGPAGRCRPGGPARSGAAASPHYPPERRAAVGARRRRRSLCPPAPSRRRPGRRDPRGARLARRAVAGHLAHNDPTPADSAAVSNPISRTDHTGGGLGNRLPLTTWGADPSDNQSSPSTGQRASVVPPGSVPAQRRRRDRCHAGRPLPPRWPGCPAEPGHTKIGTGAAGASWS
jgi:hypothetical protein